jgi:hypothetical protein
MWPSCGGTWACDGRAPLQRSCLAGPVQVGNEGPQLVRGPWHRPADRLAVLLPHLLGRGLDGVVAAVEAGSQCVPARHELLHAGIPDRRLPLHMLQQLLHQAGPAGLRGLDGIGAQTGGAGCQLAALFRREVAVKH